MTGQTKTHPCNEQSCWKECNHGCCKWGHFGMCSKTCGGGKQSRVCMKGSMGYKGRTEHRSCNWVDCPKQCMTGCCVWGPWGECSKSCDGGMVTRRCHEGPRKGQEETHQCNEHSCPTNGCKVGCCRWGGWGMCSKTCGGGSETRTCIEGGDKGKQERRSCSWEDCPTPPPPVTTWPSPAPMTWIKPCTWDQWGECPVTCGTGQMQKTCRNGIGEGDTKTMPCKKPPCPVGAPTWPTPPPPVGGPTGTHHGCGHWGEWEMCTRTCDGGMRYRVCMAGSDKGKKESKGCNEHPCETWPTTTPKPHTTTWHDDPGIHPPKEECEHWNDWSRCGKSCLRCRCCADAPDYNPPRPSMQVKRRKC